MNKKILFLSLLLLFLLPALIFAETIVLKSGEVVEGKIVDRNDKYIGISYQNSGTPDIYYAYDEIESIDGVKLNITPAQERKWKTHYDPVTKSTLRVEDSPNDPANAWKKLLGTIFLIGVVIAVFWFLSSR